MTIKIFDKNDTGESYVVWSPVENNELHVVTSKGWQLQAEGSKTFQHDAAENGKCSDFFFFSSEQ